MSSTDAPVGPPGHLCVLVHGLWGNPGHLNQLVSAIKDQFAEEQLHVLVPKTNAGNSTYDGIELGGERVTQETEAELDRLAKEGHNITKISMIGYSLGGLIARYAVGLLYSKGWFERLEPVNFTTFATPHLGSRTPRIGVSSKIWNMLGSRTLSVSGRQLFLIDRFRDTGRPLLSILAAPSSIFIRGLKRFKNRSLYANIINDRSVVYHTAMITSTDPYVDLDPYTPNYLPGLAPILLDPSNPLTLKQDRTPPTFYARSQTFAARLPMYIFFTLFLPVGASIFLVNAAVQSVQSQRRIRAHDSGSSFDFSPYRIPLLASANHAAERVFERANSVHGEDFLPSSVSSANAAAAREKAYLDAEAASGDDDEASEGGAKKPQFPTLALHPEQFRMIDNLDQVGWRKFPVHIHKATHSHAAIIVRMKQSRFDDGKVVIKHWLDNFEL
ncbi:DUF676-domain-containing protein [Pseudovirgaria hyperparasitica]|uniref:DUF676-domain-containing protein n=1 Tax=Pseudovirgaria hyperparasitica TaxID=470096 RepID=A0A6A6W4W5_9PEZI|nr:DUF676-domain-containing protein [Pseudovirgaria hyperparasitica]KAF2757633.1 DUF676-domain-containing protein [Pseudovirgaria hyperparasitica]